MPISVVYCRIAKLSKMRRITVAFTGNYANFSDKISFKKNSLLLPVGHTYQIEQIWNGCSGSSY